MKKLILPISLCFCLMFTSFIKAEEDDENLDSTEITTNLTLESSGSSDYSEILESISSLNKTCTYIFCALCIDTFLIFVRKK